MSRSRFVVLVNGIVASEFTTRAVTRARSYSRVYVGDAVAVCRLGPTASRTLRRFAAGQEITR